MSKVSSRYEASLSLIRIANEIVRAWLVGASPSGFNSAVHDLKVAIEIYERANAPATFTEDDIPF